MTLLKLVCLLLCAPHAASFSLLLGGGRRPARILQAMPTTQQLETDGFMKQVAHAAEIVPLLSDNDDEELSTLLQAQLSHSDGIRGFFVNYLTAEGETAADSEQLPPPLALALEKVSDRTDLISLACMNVIMPTAMSTMHTDEELRQSSCTTSRRGIRVMKFLNQLSPNEVQPVRDAILSATTEGDDGNAYWKQFFENYGYRDEEIKNIASAISECQ